MAPVASIVVTRWCLVYSHVAVVPSVGSERLVSTLALPGVLHEVQPPIPRYSNPPVLPRGALTLSLIIKWSAVAQLVECRTRNRESPGSNPRCYRFEDWAFFFHFTTPQSTQLYK